MLQLIHGQDAKGALLDLLCQAGGEHLELDSLHAWMPLKGCKWMGSPSPLRVTWVCVHSCREKVVSMEFMRKYIHVAKMIKPVLTEESASYIAEEYSRLRSQSQTNSDVARVRAPSWARRRETEAQASLLMGVFHPGCGTSW